MLSKIGAILIHAYLVFVFHTSRWQIKGYERVTENAAANKPQIFVFWHGRSTMMPAFRAKTQDTYVIASRHRDGQLVTHIMRAFGLKIIRGSSRKPGSTKNRGGREALLEAIEKLREGNAVALTPDGPRGPRMRVNGHVVSIARMSGAEIIPMCFSSTHGRLLNNWDRYFIPLPFGRAYYFAGKPITVPRKADAETVEKIRKTLEDSMIELVKTADQAAHRNVSPEPAPLV